MARPREFDELEVIAAATPVFRSLGFAGASVGELCAATGLSRASLYGAFQDKEGLYRAVIAAYQAQFSAALSARSNDLTPVLALLDAAIEVGGEGCLIALGISQIEGMPEAVRADVQCAAAASEVAIADAVRRGQVCGEIDPSGDAAELAGVVGVFLRGLSTVACQGVNSEALRTRAEAMIRRLRAA